MKNFLSSLVVVSIVFGILQFTGCAPEPETQTLNWLLYAQEINGEGQVLDAFPFALTADVPTRQDMENAQALTVNIIWPDSFRLSNNGAESHNSWASGSHETDFFYFFRSASGEFGLAPEKGYMIFLQNGKDTCIVASADPNTPIKEILVFFENMESVKRFQ